MLEKRNKYICVECGANSSTLYKQFKNGIMKLSQCTKCSKTVDMYTEYDKVLLLLDLLLHKAKAFRHLLFNQKFQIQWRLVFLLALSDAYLRWQTLMQCEDVDHLPFLQWYTLSCSQFFPLLIITLIEYAVQIFVTVLLVKMSCCLNKSIDLLSSAVVVRVLSISSYGKLFNVAVNVWGEQDKLLLIILTKLFVMTSNVQAISVALPQRKVSSSLAVVFGVIVGAAVAWVLSLNLE